MHQFGIQDTKSHRSSPKVDTKLEQKASGPEDLDQLQDTFLQSAQTAQGKYQLVSTRLFVSSCQRTPRNHPRITF